MIYLTIITILISIAILYYFIKRQLYIEKFSSNIENKTILVTCATSGLGLELVNALSKRKINLYVTGRVPEKVFDLVNSLQKVNKNVRGKSADFLNEKEVTTMWKDAVKEFKKIDIVIHLPIKSYTRFKLTRSDKKSIDELLKLNNERIILLNGLVVEHMRRYKIKGKIIHTSSSKALETNTKLVQGAQILSTNSIEKYSELLSSEVYKYGISVCTIRIDRDLGENFFNYKLPMNTNKMASKILKPFKKIPRLFGRDPKKIVSLYLHVLNKNNIDVSGKIFSTESFILNDTVSDYINPEIADRNRDHITYLIDNDKNIPKNKSFFNKQVTVDNLDNKLLKTEDLLGPNIQKKYSGELNSILAERVNVQSDNIVIFKNETSMINKLLEIIINSKNSILSEEPAWENLIYYCKENAINRQLLDFKIKQNTLKHNLNKIDTELTSNTKVFYISSPNILSGKSLKTEEFKEIMLKLPKSVVVIVDQRYFECSYNKNKFDASKYINKHDNLVVLRSLNNFYGIEPLELAYIVTNKKLADVIDNKNRINDITNFSEKLATKIILDEKYSKDIQKKIKKMNEYIKTRLNESNIDYLESETNFILVNTFRNKDEIAEDLNEENIVLYKSGDEVKNYWTLPIPLDKDKIDTIINVLNYSV